MSRISRLSLITVPRSEIELDNLRVVIPVGGEAKRLKPLTCEVSKPVVRFLNRPIIETVLVSLARQGIRNFIFGVKGYLNYRSLYDYFKEGVEVSARYEINPRIHIKYQPRTEDVGSADSLRIVMDYYDVRDPVLVIQGDNILDIDLPSFVKFHEERDAFMTIALTKVKEVESYGIADINSNFGIRRFVEKPSLSEAPSNLANAGVYLIDREIREVFQDKEVQQKISEHNRLDFGMDLIPYVVSSGRRVCGYVLEGRWFDLGTPVGYLKAMSELLQTGARGIDLEGRVLGEPNMWIQGQSPESAARRQDILRKVKLGRIVLQGGVLIGRHCLIGEGTSISNSSIDNFSIIGRGSFVSGSAVMDRAVIEDAAEIRESIVGRHAIVKSTHQNPTRISDTSVVGDDAIIGQGCKIIESRVYPHSKVPDNLELIHEVFGQSPF